MADYPVAFVDPVDLVTELTFDGYDIDVELIEPRDLIYEIFLESGSAERSYVNRVWDSVANDFVRWTSSQADSSGSFYPGPGTFGVDTSDFVVETVQYGRLSGFVFFPPLPEG